MALRVYYEDKSNQLTDKFDNNSLSQSWSKKGCVVSIVKHTYRQSETECVCACVCINPVRKQPRDTVVINKS